MSSSKSCRSRWRENKNFRIRELHHLWKGYQQNGEGPITEYGLCFDFVPSSSPASPGYWRWQLSYGGPADEFRFYADSPHAGCRAVEYVFIDWFDGHSRRLAGRDFALLAEIWQGLFVGGAAEWALDKAGK